MCVSRVNQFFLLPILLLPSSIFAAAIPDEVRDAATQRVEEGLTVGIIIALVDTEGVDYFARGHTSLPDGPVPTEHTLFEVGSVTKVFTGILLAQMSLNGDIALEDPVSKHLPEHVVTRHPITLRQLATHTSGLPRLPRNFRPANMENPYVDYSEELLYEFIATTKLKHDPDKKYLYSNAGGGLLGHLLALAGGKSYEQLLRERILKPLHLEETAITLPDDMKLRLAQGHDKQRPVMNWDIPVLAGAGALRSTAADLVAFLQANLGLTPTPLRDALDLAQKPHTPPGLEQVVGLGWHRKPVGEGRDIIWHNGGTGGYTAFVAFRRDTQTGVVILANSAPKQHEDIGFHLLDPAVALVVE